MVSRASFTLQLSSGNAIKASIFVPSKSDNAALSTHRPTLQGVKKLIACCNIEVFHFCVFYEFEF